MSGTAPQITASQLSKQYGEHTVFENISFQIEPGQFVALIGPNGAGKSTLIKMLLGLETPTKGTILVEGNSPLRTQHLFGYIPQRFTFDRTIPITVKEFMSLISCDNSSHVLSDHVIYMLERVGLAGKQYSLVGHLSGGELQRLLVARALVHHRSILVFDEPASGIDIHGEKQLYELLQSINKEWGTTCIVVSHELDFVFSYATTVLCVNRQLLCHGDPYTVLSERMLTDVFGDHKHIYRHHHS